MLKPCLITFSILFYLAQAAPNYADPSGAGDWTTNTNCINAPSGFYKSPIFVKNSSCTGYQSFNLTMEDDNANGPFETTSLVDTGFGAPRRYYFDGRLAMNGGRTFVSAEYHVRTRSEHVLPSTGTRADAELQVYFYNAPDVIGLSFLIREIPQDSTASIYTSSPYAKLMSSITSSNWQLNFKELAERITNHANYNMFLNLYLYPGTYTCDICKPMTWLVFGQELYATKEVLDIIRERTADVPNAADTADGDHNARPYTGTGGGSGEVAVTKLCYKTESLSEMLTSVSLILILLSFIVTA